MTPDPAAQVAGKLGKLAFELTDRGVTVRCWYPADDSSQLAHVRISRGTDLLRMFEYPAYRIWNIAAHFSDIVDGLLEADNAG